jgi:thioester reductase-like protein
VKCFQTLAETIDVIYHNGALVNFAYPYHHLRAANVLGTLEVLKLAASTRIKPLHFVSTLGVFSPADSQGKDFIDETTSPAHGETLRLGYTRSKCMAEHLMVRARSYGLPVCIHRPGRVAGDSRTGACHTSDFFWRLIRACIRMAKIPSGEGWVSLAPVDYVCRAIVYTSRQVELLGENFHYFNPDSMPLRQFTRWMRSYGYWLEHCPYEQWCANLIDMAVLAPESNETSLAPFFWGGGLQGSDEGGYQFSCQNTLTALSGSSIVCPPVDAALLETYFSYLVRIGFLDAPVL